MTPTQITIKWPMTESSLLSFQASCALYQGTNTRGFWGTDQRLFYHLQLPLAIYLDVVFEQLTHFDHMDTDGDKDSDDKSGNRA